MAKKHNPIPNHFNWHSKKVLLLEDNKMNYMFANKLLLSWRIKVDYAHNVVSATAKAQTQKYDCIFADIELPDGSGLDFICQIQQNKQHLNFVTPIIVLSATLPNETIEYAVPLLISNYLEKPFEPNNLFKCLCHIFEVSPQDMVLYMPNKDSQLGAASQATTPFLKGKLSNNPKGLQKIIAIFETQYETAQQTFKHGIATENWESVFFEAHKLKSTAGILGLNELQVILAEIEKNANTRQYLYKMPQLYEHFVRFGEEAQEQIKNFLLK